MVEYPNDSCYASYIGETGRRLEERAKEQSGSDFISHVVKHWLETGHPSINNFKILSKNSTNNFKRQISEALYINQYKAPLNVQDKSVSLKLLNKQFKFQLYAFPWYHNKNAIVSLYFNDFLAMHVSINKFILL